MTAGVRLTAIEQNGLWLARATRQDTGDPFGIECQGPTRADALARLTRWLEWQSDHAAALDALQRAERAYHRSVAGSAFVNPTEGPTSIETQKYSLDAVDASRVRLDEIRARRPD
jgi:hypothetical protein